MNKPKDWNATLYIVTWNVSTKFPDNVALHNLLNLETLAENDDQLPDFYVVGLQEVNSQPQNVFVNFFRDDPWTNKIKELLKDRGYVAVKTEQMQGLLLTVFAKRAHIMHLREIESEYTRTGLGGIWGNKGAISIRMNVYGISVCLICAHLAAHDHMLDERINDYNKIVEEHKYHVKVPKDIFSHDYIFWFGDLNFRLTGEATSSPEKVRDEVKQDKLKELMERDQLRLVMKDGRAFKGMEERLPEFPPTFKFEPGTSEYDMKRRPAWCDRILFKVSPYNYENKTLELEQRSYKSHPDYTISDHKPVTSEFKIRVDYKKSRHRRSPKSTNLLYDQIDDSSEQVSSEPEEDIIEFAPMKIWRVGEENIIEYFLPVKFDEDAADWIGVYREDFASLSEYVCYEYTSKSNEPIRQDNGKRRVQMVFSESCTLPLGSKYQLLYFQSSGTRGVTGLVGISSSFDVEKRSDSPRFDTID